MSHGSVSIDVRGGFSINVGWVVAVAGRVVSVNGGRRVLVDERVMLSLDALHFSLQIECSQHAGFEKSNVCSLLLLIDVVYNELNTKFETLNTHVKKLETQVVQKGEVVKKQETFNKGNEALKYHVKAIIEANLCQVVKEEKLQEGDFDVESSMSFGG
ncbi:hypothetical protein DY000_02007762 [Brassica cretica]|uniref:Uncharacterized protein n=1 Tax=Brassica cretica TaxID=69181 RepID=A0ABQ7C1D6_BRACR|nr:hypothetical protein DY000_02007762 [Brassica cretica]